MTATTEPLLDSENPDYGTMVAFDPADGFAPSLPSLISRRSDTDAQSVSDVESISNGETISDTADDFDEITYSEVPDRAGDAAPEKHAQGDEYSDEDMERVTMSDRTIIPDTPSIARIMTQQPNIKGFYLASEPYRAPDRRLRLMFVADARTTDTTKALIVNKLVTSIAAARGTTRTHQEGVDSGSGSLGTLPIPVDVQHVVAFHPKDNLLELQEGEQAHLDRLRPDFAILYRQSSSDISSSVDLASILSHYRVPLLEVACNGESQKCVVAETLQADHFLRSCHGLGIPTEEEEDFALPQKLFLHVLKNNELSRHLAFISNHVMTYSLATEPDVDDHNTDQDVKSCKPWSYMSLYPANPMSMTLLNFLGYFIATSLISGLLYNFLSQSPLSQLSTRALDLQVALNGSGLANMNATHVLAYPTTITISGNSTSTVVSYPTAANVQVVKPDQLLLSVPSPLWTSPQIDVYKNGKTLNNVNITSLIKGVYSLSLPSSDAYGHAIINVFFSRLPRFNHTIKVDLGNRALQRVAYENAAKGVQHVCDAHNAAKLYQEKLMSEAQSVVSQSIYGFKTFGDSVVSGVKSTGETASLLSNHMTQGLRYVEGLTYNTTSPIGTFLWSAIPRRHHLLRARSNARKIRTAVLGSRLPKNGGQVSKPTTFSRAVSAIKERLPKVPNFFARAVAATENADFRKSFKFSRPAFLEDKSVSKDNVVKSQKGNGPVIKQTKRVAAVSNSMGQKDKDRST